MLGKHWWWHYWVFKGMSLVRNVAKLAPALATVKLIESLDELLENGSIEDLSEAAGVFNAASDHLNELLVLQEVFLRKTNDFGVAGAISSCLMLLGRYGEGAEWARLAYDLAKSTPEVSDRSISAIASMLFFYQSRVANWTDRDDLVRCVRKSVAAGEAINMSPFYIAMMDVTPQEHLYQAIQRSYAKFSAIPGYLNFTRECISYGNRVKIGYVSWDVQEHATAYLMAGLFEKHDARQFEVFLFGHGPAMSSPSPMRKRLMDAVEHFVDISLLSDDESVALIRRLRIDVLVDLKGHTLHGRLGIFAHRPSSIQVSYLGFPGSTGMPCMDYMIADHFLVPEQSRDLYLEKIAYLPNCYQPTDDKREIGLIPSRKEMGLPENAFVFCSFNTLVKLTPKMFDVWCRILQSVPDSVLWLISTDKKAQENIVREAVERGVDASKFVFASQVTQSQHLARLALADLFLDSFPVVAHTTASDSLWAGLPILTMAGESFVSRVAGSILKTIGVDELIVYSYDQYFQKALFLAKHPEELSGIRKKIAANKKTSPLFDTARYTRNLEAVYMKMIEAALLGNEPDHIILEDEAMSDVLDIVPFEYDSCPTCGEEQVDLVDQVNVTGHLVWREGLPTEKTWVKCSSCQHEFSTGYFDFQQRQIILDRRPFKQPEGDELDGWLRYWGGEISRVLGTFPSGALPCDVLWLDMAAGDGVRAMTLAEMGVKVTACSPDSRVVASLREKNIPAIMFDGSEMLFATPGEFDVICLGGVLSEVGHPLVWLPQLVKQLRLDGLLWLSVPYVDAASWVSARETSSVHPWRSAMLHSHHYSASSLRRLLDAAGLRMVGARPCPMNKRSLEVLAKKM